MSGLLLHEMKLISERIDQDRRVRQVMTEAAELLACQKEVIEKVYWALGCTDGDDIRAQCEDEVNRLYNCMKDKL